LWVQLALIFVATITPYEVAMLEPSLDNALFWINRVVDGIFSLDICVQFMTMTERNAHSLSQGRHWVTSPTQIAKNYLCSWFLLDVVSVGVSAFDSAHAADAQPPPLYILHASFDDLFCHHLTVMCATNPAVLQVTSTTSSVDSVSNLKVLKTLRILRLFKLMRLLRASRIAKRWETRMSIDYAMLSIAKCIIGVLVAAHWMACVWVLQVCTDPPAPPPQLHTGIGSRHLT
jgi:hypothetical protein